MVYDRRQATRVKGKPYKMVCRRWGLSWSEQDRQEMSPSEGQLRVREAEMIWKCAEEGDWIYWTKDDEDGASKQEERRKTSEKIHG